jgi:hypothetical protein
MTIIIHDNYHFCPKLLEHIVSEQMSLLFSKKYK